MPKLYQLTENYNQFHNYVENVLNSDEEFTEEELQTFVDTLDAVQDSLENKVDNIVKFLKNMEGDVAAYKSEEARLAKKRKTLENTYDGLKEYTRMTLMIANIEKLKTPLFSIRLQANPPSVFITNENLIPDEYKVPQPSKISNKDILTDLKLGVEIAGARLADEKKHIRFS
jgi:outer membrane murein-binding lipoprotein Lpp